MDYAAPDIDASIRVAAFSALDRLLIDQTVLPWKAINAGFTAPGVSGKIHFANRARGIFNPEQMDSVLSVKTVIPRGKRKVWYKDQTENRTNLFLPDATIRYSFQGADADSRDNTLLRAAAEKRLPLIYFLAVSPAFYVPLYPVFVSDWNSRTLEVSLVFSVPSKPTLISLPPRKLIEKQYRFVEAKQRVHQAQFREAVLQAHGNRCAITGLRGRDLLDASHIIPDGNDEWGQPAIQNGLPLSKIHHKAYDSDLIGIDRDGIVHVSDRLLRRSNPPQVKHAIKSMEGKKLLYPHEETDWPDRDRLAMRFKEFEKAN